MFFPYLYTSFLLPLTEFSRDNGKLKKVLFAHLPFSSSQATKPQETVFF